MAGLPVTNPANRIELFLARVGHRHGAGARHLDKLVAMHTTLRAVLFDMDGTLTDSETLWTIALDRTAADLGGELSTQARRDMVGHDMGDSIRMLLADIGIECPHDEVAARLTGHMVTLFGGDIPWQPGAAALLADVKAAGLRTALVTATHRTLVDLALNTLGRNNFDAVVCGDEVAKNKPHPEPYLRAVELLGVDVGQSLAIEDSPNGSASALAAGLPVLVVPSEVPVPRQAGVTFEATLSGITAARLQQIHAAGTGQ